VEGLRNPDLNTGQKKRVSAQRVRLATHLLPGPTRRISRSVARVLEESCVLLVGDQVPSGADPQPAVTAGAVKVYERTAHGNGLCRQ